MSTLLSVNGYIAHFVPDKMYCSMHGKYLMYVHVRFMRINFIKRIG